MEAKTWRAKTLGIRISKSDAANYFDRSWSNIEVRIEGKFHNFNLSDKFWTTALFSEQMEIKRTLPDGL